MDYDKLKEQYEYPDLYTLYSVDVHSVSPTVSLMRFRDAIAIMHAVELEEKYGRVCLIFPPK